MTFTKTGKLYYLCLLEESPKSDYLLLGDQQLAVEGLFVISWRSSVCPTGSVVILLWVLIIIFSSRVYKMNPPKERYINIIKFVNIKDQAILTNCA